MMHVTLLHPLYTRTLVTNLPHLPYTHLLTGLTHPQVLLKVVVHHGDLYIPPQYAVAIQITPASTPPHQCIYRIQYD